MINQSQLSGYILSSNGTPVKSLSFVPSSDNSYIGVYAQYGNNPAWVPLNIGLSSVPTLQQVRDMNLNISMNNGSYKDAHLYLRSAAGNNVTTAFYTNAAGGAIQSGDTDSYTALNLQPLGGLLTYGGKEVATTDKALVKKDTVVTNFNAISVSGIYTISSNLTSIANYPHIGNNNNGATGGILMVYNTGSSATQFFYPNYESDNLHKGGGYWYRKAISNAWEYKNGVLEIKTKDSSKVVMSNDLMIAGDYIIVGNLTTIIAAGYPDTGATAGGIPLMVTVRKKFLGAPHGYALTQEAVSMQESSGNLTRKWIRTRYNWRLDGNAWDSWNEVGLLRDVYTKSQLNTSGAGGIVHWNNISNAPSFITSVPTLQDVASAGNTFNGDIVLGATGSELYLGSTAIGDGNTRLGRNTLAALTDGNWNTAIGSEALKLLATGVNNTAVGEISLPDLVNGYNNSAVGDSAGIGVSGGNNNTYIGILSGAIQNGIRARGNFNTFVGRRAGGYTITGSATLGSYNIALGIDAGHNKTDADNQLFIGHYDAALFPQHIIEGVMGTSQMLKLNASTTISTLSGTGTRIVTANATGLLGTVTLTNGTVTSVTGTPNRITITNGTTTPVINIATNYVGQISITTLGTITSGTWNASTIAVNKGGTGTTTLTGVAIGNGTSAMTGIVGVANQLLRRNAANTGYEFFTPSYTSSLITGTPIATSISNLSNYSGYATLSYDGSATKGFLSFRSSVDGIGAGIESGREGSGSWNTYLSFYVNNLTGGSVTALQERMRLNSGGVLTLSGYAGAGTRIATLDSNGVLGSITNNFLTIETDPTAFAITSDLLWTTVKSIQHVSGALNWDDIKTSGVFFDANNPSSPLGANRYGSIIMLIILPMPDTIFNLAWKLIGLHLIPTCLFTEARTMVHGKIGKGLQAGSG